MVGDKRSLIYERDSAACGGGKTSFGKFVDTAVVTTGWNKTVSC